MEDKNFALLVDSDNISAKYIRIIMDELAKYGTVTYKRIYGDWTRSNSSSWKDVLLTYAMNPVQQYSYTTGKNATDSAMIIDAMDILYSGNVNGFCLASSDSDFTKLAMRLRESGMKVIGMGESKTPEPFRVACERFVYLDLLAEAEISANSQDTTSSAAIASLGNIESVIQKIIMENGSDGTSMDIGELGSRITKFYPAFDTRNYGYTKLSKFLDQFASISLQYTETTVTAVLTENDVTLDDIHTEVRKLLVETEKKSMSTGELCQKINKKYNDFNINNYGYTRFAKMLQDFKDLKVTNLGRLVSLSGPELTELDLKTPIKNELRPLVPARQDNSVKSDTEKAQGRSSSRRRPYVKRKSAPVSEVKNQNTPLS